METPFSHDPTLFARLFDAIPDFIYHKDGEGRWTAANKATCALFELNENEYVGKTNEQIAEAHPFFKEALLYGMDTDERAWEESAPYRGEEFIPEREGTFRVYDVVKVPLYNEDGSRRGLATLGRDITSRTEAEEELWESRKRFRQAINEAPFPILIHAENDSVVMVSKTWAELSGYTIEEIPTVTEWLKKATGPLWNEIGERFKTLYEITERTELGEFGITTKTGEKRVWHITSSPLGFVDDHTKTIISIALDLTEKKKAEEKLRLAAKVFESSNEGVIITNVKGEIVDVNNAFAKITGYDREDVLMKTIDMFASDRHTLEYYNDNWRILIEKKEWSGEIWTHRKNGDAYAAWVSVSEVDDERGFISHYIFVFSDITPMKKTEEDLRKLAHYDVLTGLPNRALCQDRIAQAIQMAKRSGSLVGIMFLDIDEFKMINDTMGHRAGDKLLRDFSTRITRAVRGSDTVARLGGDEFLIILTNLSSGQAATLVAHKIIEDLVTPFAVENKEVIVTTSIGITIYPNDGNDIDNLVKNADTAMYRAKTSGKNTYTYYTPKMNEELSEQLEIETGLYKALNRQEFLLHYQPRINLVTGEITGMEALIRWEHPTLGMLSPAKFLPSAEKTGVIFHIGEWGLRTALAQCKIWQRRIKRPLTLSLNLSTQQARDANLVRLVKQAIEHIKFDPAMLELELRETVISENNQKTREQLLALRELGVKLAIDHFGVGFASLSALQHFPVTTIKIDTSFIGGVPDDENSSQITRAIISLGHSMNIKVEAEGVELREQVAFLREYACDGAQGYAFSKPLPPDEFEALLVSTPFFHNE